MGMSAEKQQFLFREGWRDGIVGEVQHDYFKDEQTYLDGYAAGHRHITLFVTEWDTYVYSKNKSEQSDAQVMEETLYSMTPPIEILREFAEDPRTGAQHKGSYVKAAASDEESRRKAARVKCPSCGAVFICDWPRPFSIRCPQCKLPHGGRDYRIVIE
jgi:hypothetical protein